MAGALVAAVEPGVAGVSAGRNRARNQPTDVAALSRRWCSKRETDGRPEVPWAARTGFLKRGFFS